MKKWLITVMAGLLALVAITGVAVALMDSGDNGDDGSRASRPVDENDGSDTGIAPICLEGAIDCDDTIDGPSDDDVCIQIYPPPSECADPDEPVSNEPPIVDPNPALCDFSGGAAECEKIAVALATEELASRLGNAEGITLRSVEFVEWPNACLGLSRAGLACAEVITPGYLVVLEASGKLYEYHTAGASRAVLVE